MAGSEWRDLELCGGTQDTNYMRNCQTYCCQQNVLNITFYAQKSRKQIFESLSVRSSSAQGFGLWPLQWDQLQLNDANISLTYQPCPLCNWSCFYFEIHQKMLIFCLIEMHFSLSLQPSWPASLHQTVPDSDITYNVLLSSSRWGHAQGVWKVSTVIVSKRLLGFFRLDWTWQQNPSTILSSVEDRNWGIAYQYIINM